MAVRVVPVSDHFTLAVFAGRGVAQATFEAVPAGLQGSVVAGVVGRGVVTRVLTSEIVVVKVSASFVTVQSPRPGVN